MSSMEAIEQKREENRVAMIDRMQIHMRIKAFVQKSIKKGVLDKDNVDTFLDRAHRRPNSYYKHKNWTFRAVQGAEEVYILGILVWNSEKGYREGIGGG